jgi:hypothetical protein
MRVSNSILIFLIFGAICITSTAQLPDNIRMSSDCSVIRSAENANTISEVGPGDSQLTFILSWQNATSNLDMTLSAPDGQKIDSPIQPPDIYKKNDTTVQYTIPNPEPGNWTAKVIARTTPEPGEGYCVLTLLTLAEQTVYENQTNVMNNESANVTSSPA